MTTHGSTAPVAIDSPVAWRMVAVAFMSGFVVFGVVYSFGVFLQPLMNDLGAGRSATSALYAISSTVFYFLGPATGRIGDRIGPRLVTAAGAVAMTAGLLTTAFVDDIRMAYVTYGLGVGSGAALAYIPAFSNLGGWFQRARTRALGIAAAGTGCGMLLVPPLSAMLIASMGWRTAMVALGAGSGLLLAGCAMAVRPAPAAPPSPSDWTLGAALRSSSFLQLYVSWVLATMALFVPLVFLPAFAVEGGADPVAASWLISIIGGASVVGRVASGYTGTPDTLGLYKVAVMAMGASYVIWLALPAYHWLVVFAAMLGVAYGVRIALVAPVLIQLFGARDLGALLGFFFTATGLAGLLGPLLAGLAVDLSGSHAGGIVAAICLGGLGYAAIATLKPTA
ncbi:MAG: MFS transporter [Hyphomicrobiaceae bacterium]|nr:MFS transporter [Hyphomicrobiaceae bacterium]